MREDDEKHRTKIDGRNRKQTKIGRSKSGNINKSIYENRINTMLKVETF